MNGYEFRMVAGITYTCGCKHMDTFCCGVDNILCVLTYYFVLSRYYLGCSTLPGVEGGNYLNILSAVQISKVQ